MARIRANNASGGGGDVIYESGTGTTDGGGWVDFNLQKISDPDFIFVSVNKTNATPMVYVWNKDLSPELGGAQWTGTTSTLYTNFTSTSYVSGNHVVFQYIVGGWGNQPFTYFAIKKN